MTTAARPTFEPAKGGMGKGERDLSAMSKQYSARDMPSHMKLKYREQGQTTAEEVRSKDFRRDLEERESGITDKKRSAASRDIREPKEISSKKSRLEAITASNLDADDAQENSDSDGYDSDDDSALYAELERIRKERAEEQAKLDRERAEQEERIRMENIISGNPLLNIGGATRGDPKVCKRWDEDVVFKNCASGQSEQPKAFINDSLRSEFHKRFMEKYIK